MSLPRLKISSFVIERLKNIGELTAGQLFGTLFENSILIVGFNTSAQKYKEGEENNEKSDLENSISYDILPNLPSEVDLCGVFVTSSAEKDIQKDTWLKDILDFDVTDNPVLLNVNIDTHEITAKFEVHDKLENANFDIVTEKDLVQWFLYIRLTARIPLPCDFQADNVEESFAFLRKKVVSGGAAFHLKNTQVYILGADAESVSGISSESKISALFPDEKNVDEGVVSAKGKSSQLNDIKIVLADMYMKGSNNDNSPQPAPVIKYNKKEFKCATICVSIDALSVVKKETKINQLHGILTESVCRSLKLNEKCLLPQLKTKDAYDVSIPCTYHFLPRKCGHFVSIAYPVKASNDELKSIRETFHVILSLPMDRPIFRKCNAFDFSEKTKTANTLLINPHEGLNPSGVKDGEVSLVQGVYAYHHYMQDNFDDNGWGCAYRSLQTICSWFRLQGYTNRPVPTHKEIQQCLVDIGDKPSSFVGSRTWIGSTEVSFVLDTLLGVSSRIVSVNSGTELSTKGGELSYHFKTQGTPVMIGGGVLAHTILGVDYNKRTGELKFLILDPHYTGKEDLNIVQGKGWCGWKGLDFWKKDAFYNMCLPIKPKCI